MERWAVVFDWDGVIVDSARAHEESWERLAREEGRAADRLVDRLDVLMPEALATLMIQAS